MFKVQIKGAQTLKRDGIEELDVINKDYDNLQTVLMIGMSEENETDVRVASAMLGDWNAVRATCFYGDLMRIFGKERVLMDVMMAAAIYDKGFADKEAEDDE